MNPPATADIRKVAANGQITLPPEFRGQHVIVKYDKKGRVELEPLYWDSNLEIFLSWEEYQELQQDDILWSDTKGIDLDTLGQSLSKASQ